MTYDVDRSDYPTPLVSEAELQAVYLEARERAAQPRREEHVLFLPLSTPAAPPSDADDWLSRVERLARGEG